MKKGLTEIIFILDRSGSMYPVVSDTIGGFNSTIEKQKELDGECLVSTVLFDNYSKVLHDRVDLKNISKLTTKDYEVGGCTALLDAVGDAIHHIKNVHKYIREEDRPEKTLFIITTDGMENASRKYSYNDVHNMPLKEPYLVGFYYGIYRLEKNSTDNIKVHEIETDDLNFYKTYEEAAVNGIIYVLEKINDYESRR